MLRHAWRCTELVGSGGDCDCQLSTCLCSSLLDVERRGQEGPDCQWSRRSVMQRNMYMLEPYFLERHICRTKLPRKAFDLSLKFAQGASGKGPRQKTSKIVKKCQKYFRHFSTFFARGKKRQKSSKSVKNIFDTFRHFSRGTRFPAPFGGL